MKLKNVVAFIREENREAVIRALQRANIRGLTVTGTKGYGEYINSFSGDLGNTCVRIDIMIEENRAEDTASIIMENAYSGLDGDGLVAILPVDALYRIKTQEPIKAFD